MTIHASITSSDTFRLRAQRSECRRLLLWALILTGLLLVLIVRRWTDGVILANNAIFYPAMGVIIGGIVFQGAMHGYVWVATERGRLLDDRTWKLGAVVDCCIPAMLLLTVVIAAPQGALAAVTAPAILLFPLVILLSILRMRPRLTLWTGIAAGLFHWAIVTYAIFASHSAWNYFPSLLTYGVIFFFHGIAGMMVASAMRENVLAATNEAESRFDIERQRDQLSHELGVARDIQRSLLPKEPPAIAGFRVAGWSEPADQTGGDYFDWMALPDGRVIFVIADATGHGIGPAMLISACRAYLRASSRMGTSIEGVLKEVNSLLLEDMPPGKFVTAAVLILDPAKVEGHLYSAGHAPLFFYSAATNTAVSWDADELPLGIDSGFGTVASRSIRFEPGDTLVLLTDGFFEWSNEAGELFGTARTKQAVLDHAREKPEEMIKSLHGDVVAFAAGAKQQDDLTAVALQFVGKRAVREGEAALPLETMSAQP